jgi:hypothetical protein
LTDDLHGSQVFVKNARLALTFAPRRPFNIEEVRLRVKGDILTPL